MSDIIQRTDDAIGLIEDGDATAEQVCAAMAFLDKLKETTRTLTERLDAAAIKWIQTNGDLENGTIRYYVGIAKTTKCRDVKATLHAVLEKAGGDLDEVCLCLSTSAFKPATTIQMLGAAAGELFETTETTDLKTGKPKLALKRFDERFQKKGQVTE